MIDQEAQVVPIFLVALDTGNFDILYQSYRREIIETETEYVSLGSTSDSIQPSTISSDIKRKNSYDASDDYQYLDEDNIIN